MAVEMFEGFDTFSISQIGQRYAQYNTSNSSSMSTGRYSYGQAITLGQFFASAPFITVPVTGRAEYYGGFDFNQSSTGNSLLTIQNTSAATITTIATSGTTVTTAYGNSPSAVVSTSTWQNLQWHLVISATVGVMQVIVDGNLVIDLSSQNTGTVNIGYVEIGPINNSVTFDNFWIINTTGSHSNIWPVGRMQVQTLYPTSNDSVQWTPLSGNNYSEVNETVDDGDTSYVYATTATNQDTYNIGSLTGIVGQVHSVKVSAVNRKDDTPPKTMEVVAVSGGTTATTSALNVPEYYISSDLQMNDDPNTSAQWIATNVDALKVGVKVIS